MRYTSPYILTEQSGNNVFAWERRYERYGKLPTLTIPALIDGDISDVQIGDEIVFEEIENGELKSCRGLKHFVKMKDQEIFIFDNHNHALYFWIDAIKR